MEPITINVNVEVALSQPTLEALGKIFAPKQEQIPGFDVQPVRQEETEQPKRKKTKKAEPEPAPTPTTAPEPEPAPAEGTAVDEDDLPPDDAPDPVRTEAAIPTMEEVRKTIREVRGQNVSAGDIQKMLKDKFGVATSAECPETKRAELIKELKKLVA